MTDHQQPSNFIWQVADLLRGPYRPPQCERIMRPMTLLRRFDYVLEATKPQVLAAYKKYERNDKFKGAALDTVLNKTAKQRFHNHSRPDFAAPKADPNNIAEHLNDYINGFSANTRVIFERFNFTAKIEKMSEANILYLIISKCFFVLSFLVLIYPG